MRIRPPRHYRFTILATLAALATFTPSLRAEWGSLRANNRTERGREAERGRPRVERGRPEAPRVAEERHMDFEAERRRGLYWAGYRPGLTIGVLPPGYVQVTVGPTGYYYYDGVFFRPTPEGPYAVVPPPVGVIVPQLPDGAEAVVVGATTYYYAGGAFYLPAPAGFAVVAAPLGAVVHGLPLDATPVTLEGRIYYQGNSTYFLPVMVGGVTAYVVSAP